MIKHCPFCGQLNAKLERADQHVTMSKKQWWVQCPCGAAGRFCSDGDEAIDYWNKRNRKQS